MKKTSQILAAFAAGSLTGLGFPRCGGPHIDSHPQPRALIDTVAFIDTVQYLLPSPAKETAIGLKTVLLPSYCVPMGGRFPNRPVPSDTVIVDGGACLRPPGASPSESPVGTDSLAVAIPISQREYLSDDYHAWISGFDPSLDSIYVFPRRETVTIRHPPDKQKRWGIGPSAGLGIAPDGRIHPFVGVTLTYNILTF